MKENEYLVAKETLGWTHEQLGEAIGVSERCPYRYANGDTMPKPVQRLLRLLVMLRLTMSERKFNSLIRRQLQ